MSFNYAKAYCLFAAPTFTGFAPHVQEVHSNVASLAADLGQQKYSLKIQLSEEIRSELAKLSTKELAELARASYFTGHWSPSLLPRLFPTSKGESWKVANCVDQILEERLAPLPFNIKVLEGVLRVTFSSEDMWLWEEFGLATEENLEKFKSLPPLDFWGDNFKKNALRLRYSIGDLWPTDQLGNLPENDLYSEYLNLKKDHDLQRVKEDREKRLKGLALDVESAELKYKFNTQCVQQGVPIDNLIWYYHIKTFCFGWREPLTEEQAAKIKAKEGQLKNIDTKFDFEIEYKIQ